MKFTLFISIPLIFFGCEIFSTRDGEPPSNQSTNLPQAFERETLINNFILSYRDKLIQDYINCFSDSVFTNKIFSFIPSSEASSQYPALNEWDLNSEENFFRNFIAAAKDISVSVNLANSNFSQQGDSIIYTASYTLTVPFTEGGIPQNYQGNLIFHIIQDNRLIWRIFFWQDFKSGDLPSWSELKGRFAS